MLSKFSEQTNDQQSETITVVMIFEGIVRVQVWRLSSEGQVSGKSEFKYFWIFVKMKEKRRKSIFICTASVYNTSHLMTLSKLSRSNSISLIYLLIETQHFPH